MMIARFLGLCLTAVLFAACGNQSTTPAAVVGAADLVADNVFYGITHRMTNNGIRTGELRGDTAYLYEADRRMDLHGVNLTFFDEVGRQTGTLTSQTGEYRMDTGSFIARGNVVLVTQEPEGTRRVETEALYYDVGGDQLWSDVDFVMTRGSQVTRGSSFRSDARFETWSVTNARTEGGVPQGSGGVSF
jgi:LPS export ABC transporter protein LptC